MRERERERERERLQKPFLEYLTKLMNVSLTLFTVKQTLKRERKREEGKRKALRGQFTVWHYFSQSSFSTGLV